MSVAENLALGDLGRGGASTASTARGDGNERSN